MRFERWKKLWDFPLKGKECITFLGAYFYWEVFLHSPFGHRKCHFQCAQNCAWRFLRNNDNSGNNSDDDDYGEKQWRWVEAHILTVVQLSGLPRLLQRLCRVRSGLSLLFSHYVLSCPIIIQEYHTIIMWISYDYMTWLIIDYMIWLHNMIWSRYYHHMILWLWYEAED